MITDKYLLAAQTNSLHQDKRGSRIQTDNLCLQVAGAYGCNIGCIGGVVSNVLRLAGQAIGENQAAIYQVSTVYTHYYIQIYTFAE